MLILFVLFVGRISKQVLPKVPLITPGEEVAPQKLGRVKCSSRGPGTAAAAMPLSKGSDRSQEDLDMTLEGKFSMVSPENSVATSIIVNQIEAGHTS